MTIIDIKEEQKAKTRALRYTKFIKFQRRYEVIGPIFYFLIETLIYCGNPEGERVRKEVPIAWT